MKSRNEKGQFLAGIQYRLAHGHNMNGKRTTTYGSWAHMKNRCFSPTSKDWENYGGRGITVCERWCAFEGFLADMGEKPEGTTLERINRDGNYEPGNCIWASRIVQNRNKRSIILTQADAVAIRASNERGVDLAKRYGVNKATISAIKTGRLWK